LVTDLETLNWIWKRPFLYGNRSGNAPARSGNAGNALETLGNVLETLIFGDLGQLDTKRVVMKEQTCSSDLSFLYC